MTALTISVLCSILMILSILFFPKVKIGKFVLDTYWIITLISALLLIFLKQIPNVMVLGNGVSEK